LLRRGGGRSSEPALGMRGEALLRLGLLVLLGQAKRAEEIVMKRTSHRGRIINPEKFYSLPPPIGVANIENYLDSAPNPLLHR